MSEIIGCYSRGIARASLMRFEVDSGVQTLSLSLSAGKKGEGERAFIGSILIGVWLQL